MNKKNLCIYILFFFGYATYIPSQARTINLGNVIEKIQKKTHKKNSLPLPIPQKIHPLLSLAMQESKEKSQEKKGDIDTNIFYNAEKYIRFNVQEKTTLLKGKSHVKYGDTQLTADSIQLSWDTNIIIASAQKKEGKVYDRPIFKQKEEQYMADELQYNFKNKKAVVKNIVTRQDDGFVHGKKAKKDDKDNFYFSQAKYTTCNLAQPHFHIGANKIKMIQKDKVVSGPFLLYFNNVPTPLGFFLGIFFLPTKRASGIILPRFGEERKKGVYIKHGGYYISINDYMDLTLRTDIYSKGSFCYSVLGNYKKRYAYKGFLSYSKESYRSAKETIFREEDQTTIKWQHQSLYNRNSSLHADVNLQHYSTLSKNKVSSYYTQDNTNKNLYSSIRYHNNFRGGLLGLYRLNTNFTYRKNLKTNETTLLLPNIDLRTKYFYPIRKIGRNIGGSWYKDISIQHLIGFKQTVSNKIAEEIRDDEVKYEPITFKNLIQVIRQKGKYGIQQTIPLTTNIKLLQYFNLSPNISYIERWYFSQLKHVYSFTKKKIIAKKIPGFVRVWNYKFNATLNTTLYGIHTFDYEKKIQAIRHTIDPSLGFSYNPDFSKKYWQKVVYSKNGKKTTTQKSKFENYVYGYPSSRKNARLDINLKNSLEIKIKTKNGSKKVSILESCNLSTNYDFLAPKFKLDNIFFNASTSILQKLITIQYSATFCPYIYKYIQTIYNEEKKPIIKQKKIEAFTWHHGKGLLGKKEYYSWNIRTTLNKKIIYKLFNLDQEEEKDWFGAKKKKQEIYDANAYVPFTLPWNIHLDYMWSCKKVGFQPKNIRQVISFSGDVKLTPYWMVSFNSGYNIKEKKFMENATKIGIKRDLHCWIIHFNWTPLGKYRSYDLSIGIKANSLKDIRYRTERSYENY